MTQFTVTLDNCADEPIHLPNLIQPNGFLIVIEVAAKTIIQISENTPAILDLSKTAILGKPLQTLFPKLFSQLQNNQAFTNANGYFDVANININSQKFICVPHAYQPGTLVLEFEHEAASLIGDNHFIRQLNAAVLNMQRLDNFNLLAQYVAKTVRQLTGYDRVMVYKFDHDYNGDVVAEEKKASLNSFLNHKFPASDIPAQARELYLKNWVRIINDVDYAPVKLTPAINAVTGEFIDLSRSFLRSVSPIHIEYLKNMGVKATLTISVVVDNKLWGLIACHHYEPKYIGYNRRMGIEFFGKVLSNSWHILETNNNQTFKDNALVTCNKLISAVRLSNNLNATLAKFEQEILEIASADGVMIAYNDEYLTLGDTPGKSFCSDLMEWLYAHHGYETFYTNELSKPFEAAKEFTDNASGILTIAFEALSLFRIIWFRGEYIDSIDWGGNPAEKNLTMINEDHFRLTPRKSFEKWTEAVKNQSKHWENCHLKAANIFKSNFAEILALRNAVYKQQKDKLEIEVNTKTEEILHLYEQLLNQYAKLEAVAFEQSHMVRGPLSTILGLVNLLETETDGKEMRLIHSMIKKEAVQLDATIKAIVNKVDNPDT